MALLTLDDLRVRDGFSFPESQDKVYGELLASAEEACLAYAEVEQGEVTEYFQGGSDRFVLTHGPVLEVKSAMVGQSSVDISRIERRSDMVVLATGTSSSVEVAITYTCGWAEGKVPSTILQAIAFTVQHLAKLQNAKQLGITSRTTEGGTEAIEQSTPPLAVKQMLERFRRNKVL